MRITNSMITNSYLYNLNGNLNRLSKYLEQESTGKAINSISDDPIKTTQSLSARNKLSSIGRYRENVKSADNWLTEVEGCICELNSIIQDAYEISVKASSDTLNDSNRAIIAEEVAALRDEVLATANATYGNRYIFAGYNTTGTSGGKLPYTVDPNGDLYYNGINMSSEAAADNINTASGDVMEALNAATEANTIAQGLSPSNYNEIIDLVSKVIGFAGNIAASAKTAISAANKIFGADGIDSDTATALTAASSNLTVYSGAQANAVKAAENAVSTASAAADSVVKAHTSLQEAIEAGDTAAIAKAQSKYEEALLAAENASAGAQAASNALLAAAADTVSVIDDGDGATSTDLQTIISTSTALADAAAALDEQSKDVISIQVGSGRTMGVSVAGTELLGRGDENLYVILDSLYNKLTSGADASEINGYVTCLQDAHSRVLSLEAGIGAKLKRLDTLSARYEASKLNYTKLKSDAEDADMAEVITNYATAQTVYNAALSAGSEIIQTSLIDFLR